MDTACRKMSAPGNRCVVTQSRSRRSAQGRESARARSHASSYLLRKTDALPRGEMPLLKVSFDSVRHRRQSRLVVPPPLSQPVHTGRVTRLRGANVFNARYARTHARCRAVDTAKKRHFDYLCIETRHWKQALQRCDVYRQIITGTRRFRIGLFRFQISARAQAQQDLE